MIHINSIGKTFNKGKKNANVALDNMTLELGDKGLYVIYGKSGSGKSTLMNMIGGLDAFDTGNIDIDNCTYSKAISDEYRIGNIGYIFQNYLLDENKNVYDNVALALRTIGVTDEEIIFNRVMTSLANVDMENYYKRDVTTLSGGQQQRVAIARAMAKGAKIILADEPTGNLDEYNTTLVLDILKELSKTQLVILVTHEEDIASKYADRVIKISDGRVVSDQKGDNSTAPDSIDKSKIFLGDKECRELSSNGFTFEFYGSGEPCSLEIVADNGKYYIASKDRKVVFVDDNSEVELLNTTKSEYMENKKSSRNVTLKTLGRIEPRSTHRIFGFVDSLKVGLGRDGSSGKMKNKIMTITTVALTIALIVIIGMFAVGIINFNNVDDPIPSTVLRVGTYGENDSVLYGELANEMAKRDDIDYLYWGNNSYLRVGLPAFESVATMQYSVESYYVDKAFVKERDLMKGKKTDDIHGVIVTTALVQCLFGEEYSQDKLDNIEDYIVYADNELTLLGACHIEGVVDSRECIAYASPEFILNTMLAGGRSGLRVAEMYGIDVAEDKVMVCDRYFAYPDLIKENILEDLEGNSMDIEFASEDTITRLLNDNHSLVQNGFVNYATYDRIKDRVAEHSHVSLVIVAKDKAKVPIIADNILAKDVGVHVLTRNDILENKRSVEAMNILGKGIALLVIFVVLIILTTLLMYANFASRVKEVGIYRAIGVKKSDIVFKIWSENLSAVIVWVVLAILVVGIPFFAVQSMMIAFDTTMLWWIYAGGAILIPATMMLLSILPVMRTLRSYPHDILTQFDI